MFPCLGARQSLLFAAAIVSVAKISCRVLFSLDLPCCLWGSLETFKQDPPHPVLRVVVPCCHREPRACDGAARRARRPPRRRSGLSFYGSRGSRAATFPSAFRAVALLGRTDWSWPSPFLPLRQARPLEEQDALGQFQNSCCPSRPPAKGDISVLPSLGALLAEKLVPCREARDRPAREFSRPAWTTLSLHDFLSPCPGPLPRFWFPRGRRGFCPCNLGFFVSTCLSLQFRNQCFALRTQFSSGSKKSCRYSACSASF